MKKSLARVAAVMAVASIVGCAGGTAKKTIVYNDITVTIKAETERAAEVRAEAIARTARRLSDEIARRIDAVSAGGKFTDLPDLTDAEIQKTAGMQLPAEELAQLKEIAKKELAKAKKEKLYPAWARAIESRVEVKVEDFTREGKFATARELVWRASTTGVDSVDALVREWGYELLNTKVNPPNWEKIEKSITAKYAQVLATKEYEAGIEWLKAYPSIRVFSNKIDASIKEVKDELVKLGVDGESVDPAITANLALVAEASYINDLRDATTNLVTDIEGRELDLDALKAKIRAYHDLLGKYNVAAEQDKEYGAIVTQFQEEVGRLIGGIDLGGGKDSKEFLYLGTAAVNARSAALRATMIAELERLAAERDALAYETKMQGIIDELVRRVTELVAENKYTDARNLIRDTALVDDPAWDAKIYAVRIGLLNSVVNPNQQAFLIREIDEKAAAFMGEEDYEGLRDYVKEYPFVHDTYAQIVEAFKQIKGAGIGLGAAEQKAEETTASLRAEIDTILEKRTGAYAIDGEKDPAELEKALDAFEKAYIAQHYNSEAATTLREAIKAAILAIVDGSNPVTTLEMNEALAKHLAKKLEGLEQLIAVRDARRAKEAYAKLLEEIDQAVSFDTQIALAEDAISKQTGIVCPVAHLQMNAALGEYARIFRILKRGATLTAGEATTLLVGATYLDQPAVFERALELGAEIDTPAARDPRKRPALLVAIETGHNSFISKINDANGSQSVTDARGDTALHYAMRRGNLSVAKALAQIVDVKAVNANGETPLFTAVRRNQAAPVKFLLDLVEDEDARKAFVAIANAEGDTAFDAACKANAHTVLDVLADAGAEYGLANLVEAAANDRTGIAQWLVERGLDVNGEDVMAAAAAAGTEEEPFTATYRYLVSEGGIEVKLCKPNKEEAPVQQDDGATKARIIGDITLKSAE